MENKQVHAGEAQYDENFYRAQKDGSFKSAERILPVVNRFIHPRNVIDIGCGVGTWLAAWQKNFGVEIYGIDGDYVDRSQLFIAEKFFHPTNLEKRITLKRRFDLAMTLEVAEHLTPDRADSFIEDLTKLSDVILFSAAIPAQGGTNHVNEQWQSYWAEKFLHFGYVAIDCVRPETWKKNDVEVWYSQNVLLYAKSSELYRYPELQEFYLKHRDAIILDAVHPKLWIDRVINFQNAYNQLQNAYVNLQNQLAAIRRSGGGCITFLILPLLIAYKICPVERRDFLFAIRRAVVYNESERKLKRSETFADKNNRLGSEVAGHTRERIARRANLFGGAGTRPRLARIIFRRCQMPLYRIPRHD